LIPRSALEAVISCCAGGDEPDCAILDALDIDRSAGQTEPALFPAAG